MISLERMAPPWMLAEEPQLAAVWDSQRLQKYSGP